MSVEIKVPTLGESVTTATVAKWLKKAGDTVAADEPIVELETDKVSVEVPAPQAGVLGAEVAKVGDEVEVGALLTTLEPGGAGAAKPAAKAAPAEKKEAPAAAPAAPVAKAAPASAPAVDAAAALPAARKMMAENSLSAAQVGAGTGKDGRITKGDVLGFLAQPAAAQAPAAPKPARNDDPREERVKMTRLRRTIARRLKDAQNTAAILTTFNEVDLSGAMEMRKEYQDAFVKKHGVKLGFMSIFSRAVIAALKEFPAINAEIDGDDVIYRDFVNLGIAVGGPNGLVVPVIKNADKMNYADIEKTIAGFGKAAREGTLKIDDLAGGTFSITNGGIYGSLLSTPILNAPQSGILGMHSIQERPVAVNGQVVIRPMMYIALSYDHRIVDGKEAVSFLVRIKQNVEDPRRLLIDV
ncbi:2-oxoglutarate dehydrogenase complex dihydrolipoyllysine-residue succinyltransferase [Acetobacter orleanensis]|uniref:Dihydrolipoyllysine-residue succinyltransferase component of 2-oxoglutarate dehydrogenase complex n=1 Tax=Acetobacter orleanensis TaxID=104099 RepID=A0A4Y3TMI1_9PROT|nr:2-oxoglutarate dehydrogenase complex dihydrolipoyllysine-residue succinyltransferase [Acetobacter orleanensis]KXV62848.1 dihydrolipoamide succinyltransferase [Acetobacter orleanensis]PCD80625.1 dihydrolipoyllysine-residue succinyltransferase [Acetobacter orleanensis]GAN68042.1 dihydrolipoamide acetyltransferase/2-oxoglutarate dehydrogenase E2 component [Acetobacter orleanensis JCM 7639]GBR27248.1 2-oxoglutarate dehydrogenase E2 component [Acetobacter orleanensis NRIC 0473]GEB82035.1 dihydro